MSKTCLKHCAIFALLFAIFSIEFNPVLNQFNHAFYGGARTDPGLYVWLTQYNISKFFSWPSQGFDADFFYPFGRSLAYSDNYLFPSLISKLASCFTTNFAAAYNLPLLLAFVLNGYITFMLATKLGLSGRAALLGAVSFMVNPYFRFHSGHPQLQYAFFLPGVMLALLSYYERPRFLSGTMVGGCVCLAFLSSVYYAMYTYLLALLTAGGIFMLRARRPPIGETAKLFLYNIPWLALTACAAAPYKEVRQVFGAIHPSVVKMFSPGPLAYFSAPRVNVFWVATARLEHMEGFLFPGAIVALLMVFALGCSFIRPDLEHPHASRTLKSASLLTLAALAVVLVAAVALFLPPGSSAGPPDWQKAWSIAIPLWVALIATAILLCSLGVKQPSPAPIAGPRALLLLIFLFVFFYFASMGIIGGYAEGSHRPGLYFALYKYLPGYNALRGTSRIGIVTILLICLLAGFGYQLLERGLARRWPRSALCAFIPLTFLSAYELDVQGFSAGAEPPVPPIYADLAQQPGQDAVLNLPFLSIRSDGYRFLKVTSSYMRWIQSTGRKMVNGYSGKMPRFHQFQGPILDAFPESTSLNAIERLYGVRYIIYSSRFKWDFNRAEFEKALAAHSEDLKILSVRGKQRSPDYLIEVTPHLHVFKDAEPKYYLPPDRNGERELSLTISGDFGDASVIEITSGAAGGIPLVETVPAANSPRRIKIRVPKTALPVKAHTILFRSIGSAAPPDLVISEIQLRPRAAQE
ncbi:MAG: hypothetical protein K1X83_06835 [Oligoflexia bacterium]|nr:hypothetical protein [Oligoflexia bacterium]